MSQSNIGLVQTPMSEWYTTRLLVKKWCKKQNDEIGSWDPNKDTILGLIFITIHKTYVVA